MPSLALQILMVVADNPYRTMDEADLSTVLVRPTPSAFYLFWSR